MPKPYGRFKKGDHWRAEKPYWNREWLRVEYEDKKRSTGDIALQFGVTDNAIWFWINKHKIPTRNISEARAVKYWGCEGEKNPMYGKRGVLNANWRGALTPYRQATYAKSEWGVLVRAVRRRDKTCRLCGSNFETQIHHIDPFSQSPLLILDIGNVILLCKKCHQKLKGKEKRWKRRLFKLIQEERR